MKSSYYKAFGNDLLQCNFQFLRLFEEIIIGFKMKFPAPNKPFPNP